MKFIMLSTLLPTSREPLDDFVVLMNDEIREIARRENVVLVDNYAAFVGRQSTLIGIDGLHPTAAGYELMAEKFFDAIKVGFERRRSCPCRSAGGRGRGGSAWGLRRPARSAQSLSSAAPLGGPHALAIRYQAPSSSLRRRPWRLRHRHGRRRESRRDSGRR